MAWVIFESEFILRDDELVMAKLKGSFTVYASWVWVIPKREVTAQLAQTVDLNAELVDDENIVFGSVNNKQYYSNKHKVIELASLTNLIKNGSINNIHLKTDNVQLLNTAENAEDILITHSTLESKNQVITINSKNVSKITAAFNKIVGGNFPILLNVLATETEDIDILFNHITSRTGGDPIEINAPSENNDSVRGVKVIGNTLSSLENPEGDAGSGFGIGFAQVRDGVVIGNVVKTARSEGLHIEDGSENITVVGNVFNDLIKDGAFISPNFNLNVKHKTHIIIGNHFKQKNNSKIGYGLQMVYTDADRLVDLLNFSHNRIEGFDAGLFLHSGGMTLLAESTVIENCNRGIVTSSGKVKGKVIMKNTPVLVDVNGNAHVEEVISTTAVEPNFITLRGAGRLEMDKFSIVTPNLSTTGELSYLPLFKKTKYMKGQLILSSPYTNFRYYYDMELKNNEIVFDRVSINSSSLLGNFNLIVGEETIDLGVSKAGASASFPINVGFEGKVFWG